MGGDTNDGLVSAVKNADRGEARRIRLSHDFAAIFAKEYCSVLRIPPDQANEELLGQMAASIREPSVAECIEVTETDSCSDVYVLVSSKLEGVLRNLACEFAKGNELPFDKANKVEILPDGFKPERPAPEPEPLPEGYASLGKTRAVSDEYVTLLDSAFAEVLGKNPKKKVLERERNAALIDFDVQKCLAVAHAGSCALYSVENPEGLRQRFVEIAQNYKAEHDEPAKQRIRDLLAVLRQPVELKLPTITQALRQVIAEEKGLKGSKLENKVLSVITRARKNPGSGIDDITQREGIYRIVPDMDAFRKWALGVLEPAERYGGMFTRIAAELHGEEGPKRLCHVRKKLTAELLKLGHIRRVGKKYTLVADAEKAEKMIREALEGRVLGKNSLTPMFHMIYGEVLGREMDSRKARLRPQFLECLSDKEVRACITVTGEPNTSRKYPVNDVERLEARLRELAEEYKEALGGREKLQREYKPSYWGAIKKAATDKLGVENEKAGKLASQYAAEFREDDIVARCIRKKGRNYEVTNESRLYSRITVLLRQKMSQKSRKIAAKDKERKKKPAPKPKKRETMPAYSPTPRYTPPAVPAVRPEAVTYPVSRRPAAPPARREPYRPPAKSPDEKRRRAAEAARDAREYLNDLQGRGRKPASAAQSTSDLDAKLKAAKKAKVPKTVADSVPRESTLDSITKIYDEHPSEEDRSNLNTIFNNFKPTDYERCVNNLGGMSLPGAHPAIFSWQSTFEKGIAYLLDQVKAKKRREKEMGYSPTERAERRRKRMET